MDTSQLALAEVLGRAVSSYISEHQRPEPSLCILHFVPCIIIPGARLISLPRNMNSMLPIMSFTVQHSAWRKVWHINGLLLDQVVVA